PYEGPSTADILVKLWAGPPLPAAQRASGVPVALDAVCRKAMARKPTDRYAGAADLARDLERWLADEPLLAYPEPWSARLTRWTRRHRTLVSSVAVLLLAVTLGVSLGMVVLGRAYTERKSALIEASERAEAEKRARQARDEALTEIE